METLSSLGKQVALARRNHGLRQIDLAEAAGLSRATIDALENGRVSDLGLSKMSRILSVLGLELNIRPLSHRPTLDELLQLADDD